MSQSLPVTAVSEARQSLLGRATSFFVYLFERIMPDPFVFAVVLTFVGAVLARLLAPDATASSFASAWYGGVSPSSRSRSRWSSCLSQAMPCQSLHRCNVFLRALLDWPQHRSPPSP